MKRTTQLRHLIASGNIIVAPGVYDGLSARLVEQAGFSAIYVSGGAIARSSGYPDIGLLAITENLVRLEQIVEVTTLPIIADADNGYGNALNTKRSVRAFERAGVSAIHLEDQIFPKRCGHLDDKKLVTTAEMVQKIHAARDALHDPDFVVIARTDAIAVEGFDAALDRAHAYLAAGADMIFVEAPQTLEHIKLIAEKIPQPKLINMFLGGKTPLVAAGELQKMGYNLVIIPSDLQRAAIFAMEQTLQAIKQDGDSHVMAERMTSFKQREVIVDTDSYLQWDKQMSEK